MIYIVITNYIKKHCVVAYEFAKVTSFFLVLPEGSGRKTAIQEYFELFDFSEKKRDGNF